MLRLIVLFILMIISVSFGQRYYENFDDQDIDYPYILYDEQYDGPYSFASNPDMTESGGYSLKCDHAVTGYSGVIWLDLDFVKSYLDQGIYIRYYRYYPTENDPSGQPEYYGWNECYGNADKGADPTKTCAEQNLGWNFKLFWFNPGGDGGYSSEISVVLSDLSSYPYGGATHVSDGYNCGTQWARTGNNWFFHWMKGVWIKYEFYIKYTPIGGGCSSVQFITQTNDFTNFRISSMPGTDQVQNIEWPYALGNIAADASTMEIVSLNVSPPAGSSCEKPTPGNGYWFLDNFTVGVNVDSNSILYNTVPEDTGQGCYDPPTANIDVDWNSPYYSISNIVANCGTVDNVRVYLNDVLKQETYNNSPFTITSGVTYVDYWNIWKTVIHNDSGNTANLINGLYKIPDEPLGGGRVAEIDTLIWVEE